MEPGIDLGFKTQINSINSNDSLFECKWKNMFLRATSFYSLIRCTLKFEI